MASPLSCWVISDGRRGIENQALGLAEAAERLRPLEIDIKTVSATAAFKVSQPRLQLKLKSRPEDYGLKPPYPQIAIGCGRQAVAPLMALKKSLGKEIFTVYIQDPRLSPKNFDLVIAPEHDGLKGSNVVSIIGSPNRITKERMIVETLKFGEKLATLPSPRITMLIGGKSKSHHLDEDRHREHLKAADTILGQKMSLLITTSRRTPEFAIEDYNDLASKNENVWVWNGNGENPYFAFLGAGDAILVTQDSTNMLTEACTTGKPVFTLPMAGKPGKFAILYKSLADRCNLSPFSGDFDAPDYSALKETERAAEFLWQSFDTKLTANG